jgi:hypothetical protein
LLANEGGYLDICLRPGVVCRTYKGKEHSVIGTLWFLLEKPGKVLLHQCSFSVDALQSMEDGWPRGEGASESLFFDQCLIPSKVCTAEGNVLGKKTDELRKVTIFAIRGVLDLLDAIKCCKPFRGCQPD